jgi:hypothetical protein
METFDVAVIAFTLGSAIGLVIGNWTSKLTLRVEFERGRLAGINQLWPYIAQSCIQQLLASHRKPAGDPPPGGADGA